MKLKDVQQRFQENRITKAEFIDQMHEVHKTLFEYAEYLPSTDIAKIEITDNEVVMTSRGELPVRIICDKDDKRIAPIEILNFLHYEKQDSDMIFRLIQDGDTILDVGANIGWYSINAAKQFPAAKIFALEPIPKTFNYLKRNVDNNDVPNLSICNFGFSSKEEDLVFYYYASGSVNASSANLTGGASVEEVRCKVVTMDKFVEERQIAIDFIKCDVEGAELFVFQGGTEAIRKHRPIVFSEMLRKWSAKFDYHPNQIIELFEGLGYRCFTSHEDKLIPFGRMDENTIETNYFFLHAEKHAGLIDSLS